MAIVIKKYGKYNGIIPSEIKVTWKDLVCIGDKVYAEEFPISRIVDLDEQYGEMFDISDFIYCVAGKYDCSYEDVRLWSEMYDDFNDGAEFNVYELPFGAESVGVYFDGMPEENFELIVED